MANGTLDPSCSFDWQMICRCVNANYHAQFYKNSATKDELMTDYFSDRERGPRPRTE